MPLIPVTIVQSGGAGAYTFISEQTVAGTDAATVTFASIPQTYRHLELWLANEQCDNAGAQVVIIQFNGDTTAANYATARLLSEGASSAFTQFANGFIGTCTATAAAESGRHKVEIPYYANAAKKVAFSHGGYLDSTFSGDQYECRWANTAAITDIVLTPNSAAKFKVGFIASLYGIS